MDKGPAGGYAGTRAGRYAVRVEEGPPRGELYELEQITTYCVLDTATGEIVLSFEGRMSACLSRDTGLWDDTQTSGVSSVVVEPCGTAVRVRTYEGQDQILPLP